MINVQMSGNPLKLPLFLALNPARHHFLKLFFRNVISGLLCTLYLYFSLLSSKIKIWQHDKCSNVRKSPQTPPFSSPKSSLEPFFSIFFSEMLLVSYIFTMYSYFSLLSSKIKIWQHDKWSIFQKSPQTPPNSSPKSGLEPFFSNFFSEMLLVGYYILCIYISAFYHQK